MAKLTIDEQFKLLRSELKEIKGDTHFLLMRSTRLESKLLEVAADQEDFRKEVSASFNKADTKFAILEKNLKAYIHDAADTILAGVDELFKGHAKDESYPHITA